VLIASIFVLGGEFWDEMRALFNHRAKVAIVAETSAAPA
jgi:hypothetical protein